MRQHAAILLLTAALFGGCCVEAPPADGTLYQTSTINALLEGVYDGDVTVMELKARGDLGLGTFNGLDGEMVVLDGEVYQVRSDGKAYLATGDMRTPFAAVTRFRPGRAHAVVGVKSFADLTGLLDAMAGSANLPCAVRIDGAFDYVKVRSVPKQMRPYPKLAEVTKTQPVFEHRGVQGTLVGFRLPTYVAGVNVPGWHLHFIDDARTVGGHLLDVRTRSAAAKVQQASALHLDLPTSRGFLQADLTGPRAKELHRVEK